MIKFLSIVLLWFMISISHQQNCLGPLKNCSRYLVSFFLYTAANTPPQELILGDPSTLRNAIFNQNANFKMVVHGYKQSKDVAMMSNLREEYFKSNTWNIIYVDYRPLAIEGCYLGTAVPSVPQIGQCAATLLRMLFLQRPFITIDKFHFIGFSLGAQICAQISKNLFPMRIPRITGFIGGVRDSVNRLNKEHANFVDVIHSNIGISGVYLSDADYDMYANDGTFQPGCGDSPTCSHTRALQIFIESINSPVKFIAVKCDSYFAWFTIRACTGNHKIQIEVGEHCRPPDYYDEIGIYQFNTHNKSPLALGYPSFRLL